MKKTSIILGALTLAFSVATYAHAEDANVNASVRANLSRPGAGIRADINGMRVDARNETQTGRAEVRATATGTRAVIQTEREGIRAFATSTRANIETERGDIRNLASSTRARIETEREDLRNNGSTTRGEIRNLASTTRQTIEQQRTAIQAEINTRKQELETKRVEVKTQVQTNIANRIAETLRLLSTRFTNEMSRLNEIKGKIDSRLTKFEQAGADTTAARADLVTASTKIDAVRTSASAIGSVQISTTTPDTSLIKRAVTSAQTAIKDAEQGLMKVVTDMRGYEASLKAKATASTSANTQ